MRTNIELDDALIAKAKKLSGLSTKKAVVERALQELVLELERRNALRELKGIGWGGDLDALRNSWTRDEDAHKDAAE